MKAGDVIGFCGRGPTSVFINVVTNGLPLGPLAGCSHVGVVARGPGDRLRLWECTTLDTLPCLVQRKIVKGTQCVDLDQRIASYRGRVWRYPLYRHLYTHEADRLTEFLLDRVGLPYDEAGAFESGGWLGLMSAAGDWLNVRSERSWFCSKEVAAALSCIGIQATDRPDKWNPNSLLRELRERQILLRRKPLK